MKQRIIDEKLYTKAVRYVNRNALAYSAHDYRTTLSAIYLAMEWAEKHPNPPQTQNYIFQ